MKPTIGIAAPADNLPEEILQRGIGVLKEAGLEIKLAGNNLMSDGRMAGIDANRMQGLVSLMELPEVSHILFAAGGYGSSRILPLIDWAKVNPKQPWIGFSDTTAMLNARIAKTGVGGWHGPMLKQLAEGFVGPDREYLREILLGHEPQGYGPEVTAEVEVMREGKARGRLLGGNLAVLRSLLGTPYAPVPQAGDILFVEDVCETNYRLDRDLEQLAQAGWMEKLGGLIFGRFSDIQDSTSRPFGFTLREIFERHAARVKGPVVMDFPAGHSGINMPLPIGSVVTLEAGKAVTLTFEGVK